MVPGPRRSRSQMLPGSKWSRSQMVSVGPKWSGAQMVRVPNGPWVQNGWVPNGLVPNGRVQDRSQMARPNWSLVPNGPFSPFFLNNGLPKAAGGLGGGRPLGTFPEFEPGFQLLALGQTLVPKLGLNIAPIQNRSHAHPKDHPG